MKRTLRFAVLLSCLLLPALASADKASNLDGKTFSGEIGKPGSKGDADTFIFKNGKFDSTACHKYGYGDAPYVAHPDAEKTSFEATTMNDKGAKMMWKGTVAGQTIEGTATMVTAKGKTEEPMTFKGTLGK